MDDVHGGTGGRPDPAPQLLDLLLEHLIAEELADAALPHVVIAFDPVADLVTVSGPYQDGLAAAAAAEAERAEDVVEFGWERTYLVTRLLPPMNLTQLTRGAAHGA
jgi:hypothetical protein